MGQFSWTVFQKEIIQSSRSFSAKQNDGIEGEGEMLVKARATTIHSLAIKLIDNFIWTNELKWGYYNILVCYTWGLFIKDITVYFWYSDMSTHSIPPSVSGSFPAPSQPWAPLPTPSPQGQYKIADCLFSAYTLFQLNTSRKLLVI